MALAYCPGCLDKQRQIDELKDELVRVKTRLRYQERTAAEGPFGSSTPSSKIPLKPSSLAERQARRGGGKVGHDGHGRGKLQAEQADRVVDVPAPQRCPDCGGVLDGKGVRERAVLDCQPIHVERIVYRLHRGCCSHCGRTVQSSPPGVLPKVQYGNGLLAHVAVQHYLYGNSLGQLKKQTGVGLSSLIDAMAQLGRWLQGVPERLIGEYRQAPVKHADETPWRTDGANGYAWLFATANMSIFRFRPSRSAAVVREVFGEKRLPGVLVVDRYAGYNRAPCRLQYCYSHLLRDLEDLEKDFPDNAEVAAFVASLAPLLAAAMGLRGQKLSARQFRNQAKALRRKIQTLVNQPARHPAVQTYQDIFRDKAHRLYHWAADARVPADNNLAERELRPLVIARKVSFGSQGQRGVRTREVLMTVLHTLRKRTTDPAAAFRSFLDQLAANPKAEPFALLFAKSPPASRH
jgi:transposase